MWDEWYNLMYSLHEIFDSIQGCIDLVKPVLSGVCVNGGVVSNLRLDCVLNVAW